MFIVGCIGSQGDVLYHIEQSNALADLIEIRLDLFFDKQYLDLFPLCKKPIIATLRHHTHGGKFYGDHTARMKILNKAVRHGALYVDMEGEYFERIPDVKMIASFHDFSGVPQNLQKIYDSLADKGDIVKIAVYAKDAKELERIRRVSFTKPSACFSMPHKESRLDARNAFVY
jgi:3-dehydroquinate dehydratase type I